MTSMKANTSTSKNNRMGRRITGQGMTEYIIIVALIALSAIAVVGFFGDVVKTQFAGMAEVLSGETRKTKSLEAAQSAGTSGAKAGTLKTFGSE